MKIKSINAREVLDSRGNPTVEAVVVLESGTIGSAIVPSGASTGKYEAVELRDGDSKMYGGLGVLKAVSHIKNEIAGVLVGMEASDQRAVDMAMIALDGTENKANLGANAILAVSLAVAKAESVAEGKPLYDYLTKFNPDFNGKFIMPIPMMNIMNGGKHASWATDIQEYMILPVGASSVTEAVRVCAEVYACLKSILKEKGYATNVGDEGGYAPSVVDNKEPFELMSTAVVKAGYTLGKDIFFGIDAAASEFFENGLYQLRKEGNSVNGGELSAFYKDLRAQYPIVSMEDIFSEDDWESFGKFTADNGGHTQIVGDDLYVTNTKRLERGIAEKTSNSILIKLNQIGTLTETIDTILLAKKNNFTSIISHRSGETEDTFIADLVVAMGAGQIKTGAPCRSERTAKYNRLMAIEEEVGGNAEYAKFPFLKK